MNPVRAPRPALGYRSWIRLCVSVILKAQEPVPRDGVGGFAKAIRLSPARRRKGPVRFAQWMYRRLTASGHSEQRLLQFRQDLVVMRAFCFETHLALLFGDEVHVDP